MVGAVIWLSAQLALVAARRRELVNGTTVPPDYSRQEGELMVKCPFAHPFAYDDGKSCCEQFVDATDPSRALEFTDTIDKCLPSERFSCSNPTRKCRDMPQDVFDCPTSSHPYPIARGKFCCSYPQVSNVSLNPECTGNTVKWSHPVDCCYDSDFIACEGGKKNCKQAIKLPVQECPSTHMFAFANGRACCAKSIWNNDTSRALLLNDPKALCDATDTISCSDLLATCKDNSNIATTLCPIATAPHPLNHGRHCCKYDFRLNDTAVNPLCDGGPLLTTDPLECCPTNQEDCSTNTAICYQNPPGSALECPASHKFAFNHGFHCCKRGVYPGSTTDTLLFTDGLDKCDAGNTMACSDLLNKCYEHVATDLECPNPEPMAYNNGRHCCPTTNALADVDCGSDLRESDPYKCCPSGAILCGDGTNKCRED